MSGSWDGKTRPSNEKYRKNFEEIFGQKEQEEFNENNRDTSKDPYKGTNIEGKD